MQKCPENLFWIMEIYILTIANIFIYLLVGMYIDKALKRHYLTILVQIKYTLQPPSPSKKKNCFLIFLSCPFICLSVTTV